MRKIPSVAIVLLGILFFAAGVLTLAAGVVNLLATTGAVTVAPRLFVALPAANICSGLAFLAVPVTLYYLLPTGDERPD